MSQWVRTSIHGRSQVWVRIYGLPIEYCSPYNLFNIVTCIIFPLKIDSKTLALDNGMFDHILVDVDLAKTLLEGILVKIRVVNFFFSIVFEKFPLFCNKCGIIGHEFSNCKKGVGEAVYNMGEIKHTWQNAIENMVMRGILKHNTWIEERSEGRIQLLSLINRILQQTMQ